MNLNQIRSFVKLANNFSFSQTAKELHFTQPTVSSYIRKLEEELGIVLFQRTTRGVELTEEGKKIYIHARQIVESAEAIEALSDRSKAPESQLIIASSTIPTEYLLPALLSAFREEYPDVKLKLKETSSENVAQEVAAHTADIGFSGAVFEAKNCAFTPVFEDELIVITPNRKKYREYQKNGTDLSWILEENVILREAGSGTRRESLKRLKDIGIAPEKLKVIADINSPQAILQSVEKGLGISFLSDLAAKKGLQNKKLLGFALSETGFRRKLYMVTNTLYPATEAVKAFARFAGSFFPG
ncbi:MAG: LysR family transcriptional regulator [Lachnospiraceae bacterium]|nr:LysR family transcriptional regulator [Lachnospiraceae bacterium]